MIAIFLWTCVGTGLAASDSDYKKFDAWNEKMILLAQDIQKLGNSIATFNKPIFETQLTKKEREYYEWDERSISNVLWNRVWAKDRTIVLGGAWKNKKFMAYFLRTSDPLYSFAKSIKIGSTIKDLERFWGMSLSDLKKAEWSLNSLEVSNNKITISGPIEETDMPEYPTVIITLVNDIVTEISIEGFHLDGCLSKKAVNSFNQKAKEMGLSTINN